MTTQNQPLAAPAPSALMNEALTLLQFPNLLLRAPFLGFAPRGRGERVLVVPGFGATNASTVVIRRFLEYLGYQPTGWTQGVNDGDVPRLLDELTEHVDGLAQDEPIHLVGWSLGGYLAREVARDLPHRVRRIVTLGSPVVGGPKYTSVASIFDDQPGALDAIEEIVDARYASPLTVPVTAVYSRLDGVVAWRACIDERSPNVEHVEIVSTHAGLGFSPDALSIIADRLAQPVASH